MTCSTDLAVQTVKSTLYILANEDKIYIRRRWATDGVLGENTSLGTSTDSLYSGITAEWIFRLLTRIIHRLQQSAVTDFFSLLSLYLILIPT